MNSNWSIKLAAIVAITSICAMFAFAISQQIPVGAMHGKVVAQENGNPISASVTLTSTFKVNKEHLYYYMESDSDGMFAFPRVRSGEYTLRFNCRAHHIAPIKINIEEGKTQNLEVELLPNDPFMQMYVHQHIFTHDEKPQVTCNGFVPPDFIDMRVYKVDMNAFLTKSSGSLENLLGVRSYDYRYDAYNKVDLARNASLQMTQAFKNRIKTRDSEGVFNQRIDIPKLAPGLYVISAKAETAQTLGWILVTDLGLVTKNSGTEMLAFATDIKTGEPAASVDVEVYTSSKKIASGKTAVDGLVNLALPASPEGDSQKTIVAKSGESYAFVSAWASLSDESKKLIYAYTDRPVYRPGQKVYFKGIARQMAGDNYKVLASQRVNVEVRDSRDTLIYRGTKRTDKFGCYFGELDLNPETATGYYMMVSTFEGQSRGEETGFQVASYQKPEFSVKVDFPKKRYVRNDVVRAKISSDYYFGAPVANAKVHYVVRRSSYWLFEDDGEEYYYDEYSGGDAGYEDYGGYGETVTEGDIQTDANGEAEIEFSAEWPQPDDKDGWDSDQQFSIEVAVTDKSRREATGDGSVIVTRGEFAINVTPQRYVVAPGETVRVDVEAIDFDKKPVKGKELSAVIARERWLRNGETRLDTIDKQRITTDNSGHALLKFSAKRAGSLKVIVKARDDRGNNITGQTYIWSYSEASREESYARYPDLQVIPDKKTYNAGDTAKILINSDSPDVTALVTVEGSRIFDRRVVKLNGKSAVVEIPVKDSYKPNFYIGVCYVKNKDMVSQEARAKVSIRPQTINISVKPNKQKYKPNEKAMYQIKTTDSKGKPLSAELSIGVVDEAIYAIAEDRTPPMVEYFYSRKPNTVNTQFSFPQIYLSEPDKALPAAVPRRRDVRNVRIRKRFLDTAFWYPNVITNENGEASVSFRFPDNLTTWRSTIHAVTLDTICGDDRNTVISQQDMIVRLEMPRFMVQTDKTIISAVVHNYTGKSQQVKVNLQARGLRVKDSLKREVAVANGGSERIDWEVEAPGPGSFPVTVRAIGSNAGDAMQLPLPVYPHGERRESIKTGALGSSAGALVDLQVRNDSIPQATRVKIRMAPSLAAAMFGSLEYLAQYPYGCTEQTTSAFIPDVILSQSLKSLGINNPALAAKLPDMVNTGLFKLYRFQLDDGGWSWCEYGESDPWMTAYVCFGLLQAKNAGFSVNQDILGSGLEKLRAMLNNRKIDSYTKAYGYYVLSLGGQDVKNDLAQIAQTSRLGSETLAALVLGFANSGDMEQAKVGLRRLLSRAVSEPGMMHWVSYRGYDSNKIETTALALQAVLRVNPKDPRAYDIIHWLMEQRRDNYWYSTRDTAMVLYAMADFLKTTKEFTPDFTAKVQINGRNVGQYKFGKDSLFQPDMEVTVNARDLHKGRNVVGITKSGSGNLYYSIKLDQYVAKKSMPAVVSGAGIFVTRTYYKPSTSYYETHSAPDLGSPITSCSSGDTILVRLVIKSTGRHEHLLLEDYIPAGCEIIDKGNVDYWEWSYWWVGRDIRDDRISFYIDELSPGKHLVTYQMRAGIPGEYHALPAQIFAMYQPQIRATTAESEFDVR